MRTGPAWETRLLKMAGRGLFFFKSLESGVAGISKIQNFSGQIVKLIGIERLCHIDIRTSLPAALLVNLLTLGG
jgi:hypothetical protein